MVKVRIKMMGTFREASGRYEDELDLKKRTDVLSVVNMLVEKYGKKMGKALIDPSIASPQPNALILMNGVEISNLNGLDTLLWDGDTLILIPVSHGG